VESPRRESNPRQNG